MKKCGKCGQFKELTEFHKSAPKKDGHSSICKLCACITTSLWIKNNPDRVAEYVRQNADKIKNRCMNWRNANKEKHFVIAREWKKKNKEKVNANHRKWSRANQYKNNANRVFYEAKRLQATPPWATGFFISEIYHLSALRTKITGVKHQVDHIVPLRHRLVCGLHVENNLRVIPAVHNSSKGNRHWPQMPETLEVNNVQP